MYSHLFLSEGKRPVIVLDSSSSESDEVEIIEKDPNAWMKDFPHVTLVNNVYDEDTLSRLRHAYERLTEERLSQLQCDVRESRIDAPLDQEMNQLNPVTPIPRDVYPNLPLNRSTGVRALICAGNASAQLWHTDAGQMTTYYTLVTALTDMTNEMPATEFAKDQTMTTWHKAILKANQGILFRGDVVHRGGAGTASVPRSPVVYQVFSRTDENVTEKTKPRQTTKRTAAKWEAEQHKLI